MSKKNTGVTMSNIEAVTKAAEFLRGELAGGRKRVFELLDTADELGISSTVLKAAKQLMGINSVRVSNNTGNPIWYWVWPEKPPTADLTEPAVTREVHAASGKAGIPADAVPAPVQEETLIADKPTMPPPPSKRTPKKAGRMWSKEAIQAWLRDQLKEGPVKSAELYDRAVEAGIWGHRMRHAKLAIGAQHLRLPYVGGPTTGQKFVWFMPEHRREAVRLVESYYPKNGTTHTPSIPADTLTDTQSDTPPITRTTTPIAQESSQERVESVPTEAPKVAPVDPFLDEMMVRMVNILGGDLRKYGYISTEEIILAEARGVAEGKASIRYAVDGALDDMVDIVKELVAVANRLREALGK